MESKVRRARELETHAGVTPAVRSLAPRVRWFNEPAAVLLGYALLLVLMRVGPATQWRAWLGGALALFGSGFSLVALLYPRRDTLDVAERLALSALLSLAVGGIIGFILTRLPQGLTVTTLLLATASFNVLCYVGVIYRRRTLAAFEQPVISPVAVASAFGDWLGGQNRGNLLLAGFLVLLLVAGVGAVYQAASVPVADPPMTEFFLLDANRQVEDFPDTVAPGQTLNLNFGITNREENQGQYQVLALIGGRLVGNSGSFQLAVNQEQRSPLLVTVPAQANGETRVDFVLFRDGKRYRDLYLWINVTQAGK